MLGLLFIIGVINMTKTLSNVNLKKLQPSATLLVRGGNGSGNDPGSKPKTSARLVESEIEVIEKTFKP